MRRFLGRVLETLGISAGYAAKWSLLPKKMKHCVKQFNKYDLYTKTNTLYTEKEVEGFKTYYSKLINYYFGTEELFW